MPANHKWARAWTNRESEPDGHGIHLPKETKNDRKRLRSEQMQKRKTERRWGKTGEPQRIEKIARKGKLFVDFPNGAYTQ